MQETVRDMDRRWNVAVAGATGIVGEAMLAILAERDFPLADLHVLASRRSAGRRMDFQGRRLRVEALADFDFAGVEIAFFSAGAAVSAEHAPRAAAAGCVVVDNTSCFRYQADVPLVVPEVNPEAAAGWQARRIVANPNCSTIQMAVVLKPIFDAAGIERVNVCTYQAVSGSGRRGVEEWRRQARALREGERPRGAVYPKIIADNVLPHIDLFQDNGYTREEMKMVWETRKIFGDGELRVNPTAVRVPVHYGHSEALHLETRRALGVPELRELLRQAPGVRLLDEPGEGEYPTALTDAAGRDAVYVGRVRADISHPRGIDLWVVADNVRKGAALNAVQIAELLITKYLQYKL